MASSRNDTTQEMARVRQMLEYILSHLRERQPRLHDTASERLFESARETLAALHGEFAAHARQGGATGLPGHRGTPAPRSGPHPH